MATLTKAETLEALRRRLTTGYVPDLLYFPLSDWLCDSPRILSPILRIFSGRRLAVRSSSRLEDHPRSSLAGHFRSCLDVEAEPSSLIRAIAEVSSAMRHDEGDQILVQEFVTDVQASGVVFTRDPNTGAPYYVVEYDDQTGRTDTVTGGRIRGKREVIARGALGRHVLGGVLDNVLVLTSELEKLLGPQSLDIEFAVTRRGRVVLLQVRPLVTHRGNEISVRSHSVWLERLSSRVARLSRPVAGLAGSRTVFGQMPDWNPAELLSAHPRPLAVSLFNELIADSVWSVARSNMGYKRFIEGPLIRILAGRPYVDVRRSFNSFLPAGLPGETENALIDAWISRLRSHPHLHDRVEFEVAQTVVDFCFEANHRYWYPGLLPGVAFQSYMASLRDLTRRNLTLKGSLARALARVSELKSCPQAGSGSDRCLLKRASLLLRQCRDLGTSSFAIIARHAFIAEAFLRSLVARGAWDKHRLFSFRGSQHSVASEVREALAQVKAGRLSLVLFNGRFGHLRPSSFDVRSSRYDCSSGLFERSSEEEPRTEERPPFVLLDSERRSINRLLQEAGYSLSADQLLEYCRKAIHGREHAKLLFSRNLSDALELIASWGGRLGLGRDELSFLTLQDLFSEQDQSQLFVRVKKRQQRYLEDELIRLPQLICDPADVYRIVEGQSLPNFVTNRSTQGAPALLRPTALPVESLFGKIVLIESADPGYDWVFSQRIVGLITKYGGSNSHMAIRCAEMSLPAAIGVGEQLFDTLVHSPTIELNCGEETVRALYA